MIQPKQMEDAFKLDCNPEDLEEFTEARKCANEILTNRKKVNKMIKLTKKVLCYD